MDATPSHDLRRARRTLVLTTLLHAFTHAYSVLLVPLYLLVVADLKLTGVKSAAVVVTLYSVVYWGLAFPSGILADRFDRRVLLGVGLLGNAVAVLGMGLTRSYEMLMVLAVVAGVAGSLFHPAANALVPAHYPRSPGMAIGLLGVGSGLGFFLGPQYAGWRAESATWHLGAVADWQRPLIELGGVGLVLGIAFLLFAREAPEWLKRRGTRPGSDDPSAEPAVAGGASTDALASLPEPPSLPIDRSHTLTPAARWQVIGIALTLGFRDFAGVAGLSLASVFLQKAYGFGARQAGTVVGSMMLLSVLVNPLAVYLSPGRRRLPALVAHLVCAAALVPFAAHVPGVTWVVVVLCLFQTCQLGSYAISDAATLERVAPAVRGRVVGLFLTIAGTIGAFGPWVMGSWVDALGSRAADPAAYAWPFAFLSGCLVWAVLSVPIIRRLGPPPELHVRPRGSPSTSQAVTPASV
jgi:FSR family fosmidomycin resistance protein-like MFS transporter